MVLYNAFDFYIHEMKRKKIGHLNQKQSSPLVRGDDCFNSSLETQTSGDPEQESKRRFLVRSHFYDKFAFISFEHKVHFSVCDLSFSLIAGA